MKFNVNQQDLQKSLNYCQGVIEKRSTLPILSNVLLNVSNSKLTITATDLDLIFIHEIDNVEIIEEGKTTATSSIMYDIIRKFSSVNGNSEAFKQFRLKIDLSDSRCNLFSLELEKLILLPEENFLTISYMIEEDVVVFPSSSISTLEI